MRRAKVGDAVWYTMGGPRQEAEILALGGATQVVVLLLAGPHRGQTPDASREALEPLRINELYRGYDIEVRVRVDKGFFTDRGFIRKVDPVAGSVETSFQSGERHLTADTALEAGVAFARKKIDGA